MPRQYHSRFNIAALPYRRPVGNVRSRHRNIPHEVKVARAKAYLKWLLAKKLNRRRNRAYLYLARRMGAGAA